MLRVKSRSFALLRMTNLPEVDRVFDLIGA